MGFELTAEEKSQIEEICAKYPDRAAALLPVLHLVQERLGHLPTDAQLAVARALDVPPTRVKEVVTFYEMFHEAPEGRFHVELCTNISCHLAGAHELMAHLEQRLGIKVGETTDDGVFSLMEAECLASCGSGPVVKIGVDYYEYLTPEAVDGLIERFKGLAETYETKVYRYAEGGPHVGPVPGFDPAPAPDPVAQASSNAGAPTSSSTSAPARSSSAPTDPKKANLPSFEVPGAKK